MPFLLKKLYAKKRGGSSLFFVIPLRLERKTYCLEGSCSIQLSYGTDLKIVTVMKTLQNYCLLLIFARKKEIISCFVVSLSEN